MNFKDKLELHYVKQCEASPLFFNQLGICIYFLSFSQFFITIPTDFVLSKQSLFFFFSFIRVLFTFAVTNLAGFGNFQKSKSNQLNSVNSKREPIIVINWLYKPLL